MLVLEEPLRTRSEQAVQVASNTWFIDSLAHHRTIMIFEAHNVVHINTPTTPRFNHNK